MAGDPLSEWLASASADAVLMEDLLPTDLVLDESLASLQELGRFVVDGFDQGDDNAGAVHSGIAAYVGESLLRLTGGYWDWNAEKGRPVICPDRQLGLATVSPLELFDEIASEEDPDRFAEMWRAWDAAARAYRDEHPSWQPETGPYQMR